MILGVTEEQEELRASVRRFLAVRAPITAVRELMETTDGLDAGFGPVLAVGLGGIWVELLGDTSLRILPADRAEVRRMLAELRALPVLQGARGGVPVDLDVLATVIAGIGELAGSLSGMQALECNPLWVCGDRVEALDVLVVADPVKSSAASG